MQCIALINAPDDTARQMAKLDVVTATTDLMPQGKPNFADIRFYPSIVQLVQNTGKATMVKVLHMLVLDFCRSVNVVRNMNEDQMIEAAAFLLDECGNFRLEDYVMMFAMAKRGQLGKIMDRVDIQVIGEILDRYWAYRDESGKKLQEQEVREVDNQINAKHLPVSDNVVSKLTEWVNSLPEDEEKEIDRSGVEAYAKLHNVDIDEVVKQFGKRKNDAA